MSVDLGSAEGSLNLDISGFVKELDSAASKTKTAMEDIESEADGLASKFKGAGEESGKGFGEPIREQTEKTKESLGGIEGALGKVKMAAGGLAAAFGFSQIVSGVQELVSITNEFQEDMGKLTTQASATGTSLEDANGAYRNMVGLLGEVDQSVEATNTLMALTQGNTDRLSQANEYLAGVYARWGDSLPLEGLTEAMNETAAAGQVVGPFADALNWARDRTDALAASLSGNEKAQKAFNDAKAQGMQNEDAFNAALATTTDEQERATMIMDAMNAMYSETGQTYLDTNADLVAYRQSQSDFNQALSNLGLVLMPLVTAVTSFGAALASGAAPALQQLMDALSPAVSALGGLGGVISSGLGAAFQVVSDNIGTIGPVLSGIATTVGLLTVAVNANKIAILAHSAVTKASTIATTAMATAQRLLNAAMSANPIVLIVSLVAGLVVALIGLYNTNENVRNALNSAWTSISTTVSGFFSMFQQFLYVDAPNAINSFIGGITSFVSSVGASIHQFFYVDAPNAITNMLNFFGQIPGNIGSFLTTAISSIGSFIVQLGSKALSAGQTFLSGIQNGFNSAVSFVTGIPNRILSALGDLGNLLVNAGKTVIDGFLNGLKAAWDGVTGWFGDITASISSLKGPEEVDKKLLINNGVLTIRGYINGLKKEWSKAKDYFATITGEVPELLFSRSSMPYISRSSSYNGVTSSGDAPMYSSSGGNTYVFNSPKAIDPIEARRQMIRASREMALGLS